MAVDWTPDERGEIDRAIARHPVESGRCAALARVLLKVAHPRDAGAHGLQVRPPAGSAARFVVPRVPHPPRWGSHTLVETEQHRVDALTGSEGTRAPEYLRQHWLYPEFLVVVRVDLADIDPGIEDAP